MVVLPAYIFMFIIPLMQLYSSVLEAFYTGLNLKLFQNLVKSSSYNFK